MARSLAHRRDAAIVTAALALGISAPLAEARPNDGGSARSSATPHRPVASANNVRMSTGHAAGGISDWGYVAIGSGATALVLIGAGGTLASRRRRRQPAAVQPRARRVTGPTDEPVQPAIGNGR